MSKFQPFLRSLLDLDAEIILIVQDSSALAGSIASSRAKEERTEPKVTEDVGATLERRLHDDSKSAQPIQVKPKDLLWTNNPIRRRRTPGKAQGSSWSHKAQPDAISWLWDGIALEHLDVPIIELTTLEEISASSSSSTNILALDMNAFIYEVVYESSRNSEERLSKIGREDSYRLCCKMDQSWSDPPQRCYGIYIDSSTTRMGNGEKKAFFLMVQRIRDWSNECRRIGVASSAEAGIGYRVNMVTTSRPELGLVRVL